MYSALCGQTHISWRQKEGCTKRPTHHSWRNVHKCYTTSFSTILDSLEFPFLTCLIHSLHHLCGTPPPQNWALSSYHTNLLKTFPENTSWDVTSLSSTWTLMNHLLTSEKPNYIPPKWHQTDSDLKEQCIKGINKCQIGGLQAACGESKHSIKSQTNSIFV